MEATYDKNLKLRKDIEKLNAEIVGDIEHGECFYEEDMLEDLLSNLDDLKELSKQYYKSNKEQTI